MRRPGRAAPRFCGRRPEVGALQLDVEAVTPEGPGEPPGGVRVDDAEPVPRASGETDEALVQLLQKRLVERGLQPLAGVGGGEQATEVRVASRRLDEQRDVSSALQGHLGAADRPDAERLRGVRELERSVDAVVVGECQRLVAELCRSHGELFRERCAVQERVRRMGVQFDVRCPRHQGLPIRHDGEDDRRRGASEAHRNARARVRVRVEGVEILGEQEVERVVERGLVGLLKRLPHPDARGRPVEANPGERGASRPSRARF